MIASAAAAGPPRVAAIRSFVRGRRRRPWFDWYFMAFAVVLVTILLSDLLAQPFGRLTGTGAAAGSLAATQAVAGAALVIGAAVGLLMLAQAFGPLALSPADASWLLLSPLDRRDVLRRPAVTTAAVSALAGAALGVLALSMAGPYLRPSLGPGAQRVPWTWLVLAGLGGAGFLLAAVLAGVLAQPSARWRARMRAVGAVVGVAAMLTAVTGERVSGVSRAVTGRFAALSTGTFGLLAAVAVAAASAVAVLVWRMLPRFPAGVVRADSARAGTTLMAAAFLNVPLLTWIAEDSHWRGRLLASRPWPRLAALGPELSPAFALAWADWRRLGRRPAVLAALAVSALAPALAGAAFTGHARGWITAAVLLAGAIAAGTQGTAATRRDTNDPTLRRLLGVGAGAALAARAVLPVLLCTAWLTVAFALLVLTGGPLSGGPLSGWLWPVLGAAAGPGVAAAALRIARTAPIDPADQGPDTPLGPTPPWLVTRAGSVLLGLAGAYPMLKAVRAGQVHGGTLAAQLAVSAVVLGGYLLLARRAASA
jgi:Family of unknown function (DUF6297)